ncbi:MAG: restriction endonuclease subunit S, partial [Ferruginibacter sp.]
VKTFTAVVKLSGGGTPDTTDESYWNGEFPFFTPADISTGYYCIETEKHVSKLGLKNSSTKLYPKDTVFVTARGTVGAIAISGCEMTMNQSCYALSGTNQFYIHQVAIAAIQKLNHEAIGAVFSALVTKDFDEQFVVQPESDVEIKFQNQVKEIYNLILIKTKENKNLISFRDLLLSKLATIEN